MLSSSYFFLSTQHCALCTCYYKRRPQRHFGFAEADIAADEAVHGFSAVEIFEDFGDGAGLVFGFDVGESGAEIVVRADGCFVYRALAHEAFGGGFEERFGGDFDALFEFGFAGLPRRAAEFVEAHAFFFEAEARNHFDIFDGQE